MLTPLRHQPTSLAPTSSGELITADQQHYFPGLDFFNPLPTEIGLSCTYSIEFYAAFIQGADSSEYCKLAMLVLEYMTVQDKARLPLFPGASHRYVTQVLPAIQEILASEGTDNETLVTKTHIINCASKLGYLTRSTFVLRGICILRRVNLVGMNLRDTYLSKAILCEAELRGADLRGADLSKADLSGADLSKADLSKADLSGADLRWANLSGANLRRTNLSRANLSLAKLFGAYLDETNLGGANLRGAALYGANLRSADLRCANLHMADLRCADLRGADLSGANLSKASLGGADFNGVTRD